MAGIDPQTPVSPIMEARQPTAAPPTTDAQIRAETIRRVRHKHVEQPRDPEIERGFEKKKRGGYGFRAADAEMMMDGDLVGGNDGASIMFVVLGGIWTEIIPYTFLMVIVGISCLLLDSWVFEQEFLIPEVEELFKEHYGTLLNMSTLLVSFYMFGMMSRSIEIKTNLAEACTLQYGALAALARNRFINAKILGDEQERFYRYRITNYAIIGFNCFLAESGGISHSRESYFRDLVKCGKLTAEEFAFLASESDGNFTSLWTVFYQMAADYDAQYVAMGYRYTNNTEPNLTDVMMALVNTLYQRANIYPGNYVQMMVFFVGVVKVCTGFLGGYTCGLIWNTQNSKVLVLQTLLSYLLILTFYASTSVVIENIQDPLSSEGTDIDQQAYMTILKTRLYRVIRQAEFDSYEKFTTQGVGKPREDKDGNPSPFDTEWIDRSKDNTHMSRGKNFT